jgi:hypothetical protein
VVLFWMMLKPYIEERRALSGEWWGIDYSDLTEACVRHLLKNPNNKLCLYDSDRKRKKDLFVSVSDLQQLRGELISAKRKRAR